MNRFSHDAAEMIGFSRWFLNAFSNKYCRLYTKSICVTKTHEPGTLENKFTLHHLWLRSVIVESSKVSRQVMITSDRVQCYDPASLLNYNDWCDIWPWIGELNERWTDEIWDVGPAIYISTLGKQNENDNFQIARYQKYRLYVCMYVCMYVCISTASW